MSGLPCYTAWPVSVQEDVIYQKNYWATSQMRSRLEEEPEPWKSSPNNAERRKVTGVRGSDSEPQNAYPSALRGYMALPLKSALGYN